MKKTILVSCVFCLLVIMSSSRPAKADGNCTYPTIATSAVLKDSNKKPSLASGMLVYTDAQYTRDLKIYQLTVSGVCADPAAARQARNDLIYGVKSDIDLLYGKDFKRLFGRENGILVTGDALALGFGAAGSIATHVATKTIFAALGTAFTGLSLSVYKNYYGQQAFQVIGTAMETRRTRLAATLDTNLSSKDAASYPLNKAIDALTDYMNAGTLQFGLTELQEEAAAANTQIKSGAALNVAQPPSSVTAVGGNDIIVLAWVPVASANSYNIYWADSSDVKISANNRLANSTDTMFTDKSLGLNKLKYYAVTTVNSAGESALSSAAKATTLGSPTDPSQLATPVVTAIVGDSQVDLVWPGVDSATSYKVSWSQSQAMDQGTVTGTATDNGYPIKGLSDGIPYYFTVQAVNSKGTSTPSTSIKATPTRIASSGGGS